MDWILTWTGKTFRPLRPDPAAVDLRDIAHALSLLCRFNGHCREFYSVAEHSVRVSHAVPPSDALAGLLHDAAEAYVSDVPRPVKDQLEGLRDREDDLLEVIFAALGVPWPVPPSVKVFDDRLLATELRDLMAPLPEALPFEPLTERIDPWSAQDAEARFLARFAELTEGQR